MSPMWLLAAWLAINAITGAALALRGYLRERRALKQLKERALHVHRFWDNYRRATRTVTQ